MPEITCTGCGRAMDDGLKVCPGCGKKTEAAPVADDAPAPLAPASQNKLHGERCVKHV